MQVYILTNNHVVENLEMARSCNFYFDRDDEETAGIKLSAKELLHLPQTEEDKAIFFKTDKVKYSYLKYLCKYYTCSVCSYIRSGLIIETHI